jgi:hypothetical protein
MPNIYGSPNNTTFELIKGSNLDDLIFPLGGWDYVDGGDGIDTVVILGLSSQFKLVQENSITYIDAISAASKYANRVQLVNVEKVQFSDKVVSLETPRLMIAQAGDDEYQPRFYKSERLIFKCARSMSDMPAGSLVPISHLQLTTEWLLPFENLSGASILEQLNGRKPHACVCMIFKRLKLVKK